MVKLEGKVIVSTLSKTDMTFYRIMEGSTLDTCIITLLKFMFEPSLVVRASACSQVPRLFLLQLDHMLSCFRFKTLLLYDN